MYEFPRADIINHHKCVDLNNRKVFSHGLKSVWAGPAPTLAVPPLLPACGGGRRPWRPGLVFASLPSLPLSSHGLLPCVSSVSLYPNPSFLLTHSLDLGLPEIQYDLVLIGFHLQRPYFKLDPIHRYWRLGLQHIFLGDVISPPHQASVILSPWVHTAQ